MADNVGTVARWYDRFLKSCCCCITEEVVSQDDEAHFRYRAQRVPNTAGIYMCPRNVDYEEDAESQAEADKLDEDIKRCLYYSADQPGPTRAELVDLARRLARPTLYDTPRSAVQKPREDVNVPIKRGKGRRKLAKSRLAIIKEMRKGDDADGGSNAGEGVSDSSV